MSEATVSAIWLTIKVASFSTLIVFIPSILLAYRFARRDTKTNRLLASVVVLPMVLPPTAIGYLLLRTFAVDGPLGPKFLGLNINLLLTWKAAVIASAIMALPLVIRTAKVAFESVDPRLESMARTLGYSKMRTFFQITLPLAYKGLIAAAIFGFTRAVGEFGATVSVAGNIPNKTQTLASAIYSAQQVGKENEAFFLIATSLALGFFAVFATEMLTKPSKEGRTS